MQLNSATDHNISKSAEKALMTDNVTNDALIHEIERKLERVLQANHLSEEEKGAVLRAALRVVVKEEHVA